MRSKINSYLGFAKKSGNLVLGTDVCKRYMLKNKIKLLIISEDMAYDSQKKLIKQAESTRTCYRIYGDSFEISSIVGSPGRSVFGILDDNFAKVILKEIDSKTLE